MLRFRYAIVLCIYAWVCAMSGADAADIRTYPTRLSLAPGAAIGSVMVKNNDTLGTAMQIEVMQWSQEGGEDKYEASRDLLVNPVIFELAPGAEQVVRIGLQAGVAATERSYRVFFQELPARDGAARSGITTLLRIGIPVFVPPREIKHDLKWTSTTAADGGIALRLVNAGTVHIQVTSLHLQTHDGKDLVKQNTFVYVLPGQSYEWQLKPALPVRPGDNVQLTANTDHEDAKAAVIVNAGEDASKKR